MTWDQPDFRQELLTPAAPPETDPPDPSASLREPSAQVDLPRDGNVIVVVDYAQRWPLKALTRLVETLAVRYASGGWSLGAAACTPSRSGDVTCPDPRIETTAQDL